MKNGRLSGYRGNWCNEFYGGPEIQRLEKTFKEKFNSNHAIAVNSCTSGLQIACGAIGLQPGDEVIVTPYSMTCSATAPMIFGATPVFADIEKDYYCLDPDSVESKITDKTKAIIVVSLFGQPYDPRINEIAYEHNLIVIEDAAQAIGSTYKNNYAGILGDIGVFSFNYGKHLTCGEGGMIVAHDDFLAMKCRLVSNHAEAVIDGMNKESRFTANPYIRQKNMVGFNMRMTELNAAILSEQLKKLDKIIEQRIENVTYLNARLSQIPAISISPVRENCTHTYYVLSYQWDQDKADGLHRDEFTEAVKAELTSRQDREGEGIPIGNGYITPLYKMPLFNYPDDICPVCEDLSYNKLFLTLYHAPNSTLADMYDVANAFEKCWENRNEIKDDNFILLK